MTVVSFLICILLTELLTELVVKSEIFSPLKKFVFSLSETHKFFSWLLKLLDCGYCFSVWAAVLSFFMVMFIDNSFVNFLVVVLVIHRLSNVFHFLIDRLDRSKK